MTVYQFDQKRLILSDPKLGIFIDEPFAPRLLPPFSSLRDDSEVTLEESAAEGQISGGFCSERGFDGQWRCWTVEGALRAECYYRDGMLHGPSRFYAENGQCLSESWFYAGLQHGEVRRYYRSGALSALEAYLHGKRCLEQLYYYPTGQMKTAMSYQEGKLHGQVLLFLGGWTKKTGLLLS